MFFKTNKTIAVIDSGIGGVSVLNKLIGHFKCGNYIYYADNLNMPYGEKSKEFLQDRLDYIINLLKNTYLVDVIVVACNTASSILDKNKYNDVLTLDFDTQGTYLTTELTKQNLPNIKAISCNDFATKIEQNILDKNELNKIVKSYINNLPKIDGDIILGCTHYELVGDLFRKYLPNKIIDNSDSMIKKLDFDLVEPFTIKIILSKESNEYETLIDKLIIRD